MFCETEAETYADPARELLFQIARGYLEKKNITAAELVFDPAQHKVVMNDGARFQEIAQRVALAQGQHTRKPVSERMKELTALAELSMKRVERVAASLQGPASLQAALQEGLFAGRELDEWVRDGVALVRLLGRTEAWDGRLLTCLEVILSGKAGPESLGMADQTASEILRLKPAAPAIYGDDANRRRIIAICIDLAGGDPAPDAGPVLLRLREAMRSKALTACEGALKQRLTEMLEGTAPLFSKEPKPEWQGLRAMKRSIVAQPLFAADEAIITALGRRFARFTAPEQLNPLLAALPEIGRKLILLLRLYGETTDGNARFELQGIISHYIDHRDFRSQFAAPRAGREGFAKLAAELSEALMLAEIPEPRKSKLIEQFRAQVAAAAKEAAKSGNSRAGPDRGQCGPNDAVILRSGKVPLRNWSPVGLLFGPVPPGINPGDKFPLRFEIRSPAFSLDVSADAEVLRVADGMVGARYKCRDPAMEQKIKAFFAA